jgi:hypothetical protein
MHDESSEYDAVASCEVLRLPLDRERAEYGDTHPSTIDRFLLAVKAADTTLIPRGSPSIPPTATTDQ